MTARTPILFEGIKESALGYRLFHIGGWLLWLWAALTLAGCGGLIAKQTYQGLDEAEIQAITDSRMQVVKCFRLGGPPVGGSSMAIIYPRSAKGRVSFSPGNDCTVKEADIDLQGNEEEIVLPAMPFKVDPHEFNPKPRAVQPPPKLKSDFQVPSDPWPGPIPKSYRVPVEVNSKPPAAVKLWEVPKPDPCNYIGATGAQWVFCK